MEAARLAGAQPLIVPEAQPDEIDALLELADGVLLTGSRSNVQAALYGQEVRDPSLPQDPNRDAWTLPLIRGALARGVPLLGICRGLQEANVALDGSLWQAVQDAGPYADHRAPDGQPAEVQYAPAHSVTIEPDGRMARWFGAGASVTVNSVHGQGVERLAPGLHVEARAPDGLIEAFSAPNALAFFLCVQWHPEWRPHLHPESQTLFLAFGEACQERMLARRS